MPDKAYDEVRFMLEAHQNDPSQVQIVLNEFLEQNDDPENVQKVPREPSPVPTKNKAGNGMVCKNRKGDKKKFQIIIHIFLREINRKTLFSY